MKAEQLYKKGRDALGKGDMLCALGFFEKAYSKEPEASKYQSFFGLCIAYERGSMREALRLCKDALHNESKAPELYLNLGKVYCRNGQRSEAVDILRKGMKIDKENEEIKAELQAMGVRVKPAFPFLSRGHFVNKYIGIVLSRLGRR